MIKAYYLLTKPGIIMGNLITAFAGFALASKGVIDFKLFLAVLTGLGGIIASACVFNNYIDRKADQKMARTKERALAKGLISGRSAIVFALALAISGTVVLALYTNVLALSIALGGFFIYVVLYSFGKYLSTHGTLVGSMAGAVPPVVGYCAVSDKLDSGAYLLFLVLVLWQMPHFFAIAMYRLEEYAAASIPVLPVIKGVQATKIQMLLYVIAFLLSLPLLSVFGYVGYMYLAFASLLGLAWLALTLKGFKSQNDKRWARDMFRLSLVIITGICIAISFDSVKN